MLAYRCTQYENRCDELEALVLSQMISLIVVGLGGMSPMAGYLIKMVTQQVGMRKGRHLMPFFPLFNIVNISDPVVPGLQSWRTMSGGAVIAICGHRTCKGTLVSDQHP